MRRSINSLLHMHANFHWAFPPPREGNFPQGFPITNCHLNISVLSTQRYINIYIYSYSDKYYTQYVFTYFICMCVTVNATG